jgi:hypothetical protein
MSDKCPFCQTEVRPHCKDNENCDELIEVKSPIHEIHTADNCRLVLKTRLNAVDIAIKLIRDEVRNGGLEEAAILVDGLQGWEGFDLAKDLAISIRALKKK